MSDCQSLISDLDAMSPGDTGYDSKLDAVFTCLSKRIGDLEGGFNKATKSAREFASAIGEGNDMVTSIFESFSKAQANAVKFATNIQRQYRLGEDIAESYKKVSVNIGIGYANQRRLGNEFSKSLALVTEIGGDLSDVSAIYSRFAENSGRVRILDDEEVQRIFAIEQATGLMGDSAAALAERFDLMGIGSEQFSDNVNQIMIDSQKIGLNSSKVVKVLSDNFASMQRMSFKGGVKAMTEMSKLAVKMRMDVSDMLGMADKFYEPEAAIEAAAQLQLMGGDIAAAFGDPFETMYLARNKPEELAKRLETMTENMIEFNDKTGEYELPPEARQQLQFAAEQLGISKDNIIDIAYQSSKIKDLKMNVSGNITDDDMRETLAGMAQMKDGQWKVDVGGEQIAIADITEEQAKKISATPEQTMQMQAMATQTNTEALINNTEALKAEVVRSVPVYEMVSKAFKSPLQELSTGLGSLVDIFGDSIIGQFLKEDSVDFAEKFGEGMKGQIAKGIEDGAKTFEKGTNKTDEIIDSTPTAIDSAINAIGEFFNSEKSLGGVLQRGGVLKGATHSDGGIPFKVGGVPGFEAENNEIILTKGVFQDPMKRKIASDLNVSEGGVSFAEGGVPNLSDASKKAVNGFDKISVNGSVSHSVGGEIKIPKIEVSLNGLSETTKLSPENERKILAMITEQITKGDGIYTGGKVPGNVANTA